ncbi:MULTISPECIES: LolA family protein [Chryseobacterium]|uniref:Outer membrane lipoprotein-sorting protein n=1 Tax=Chryseobacterium geocarposphaerae TaxID=1416776 RepID=A0A2M9C7N2_9FLAO|nr:MULTISPECIES: outer membrane lipoprotein carrier protein LolA [Chryseobacterium]MPS64500.1 outer membrane lipoprotein carrier protein LolA [Chryseobacterium sp.]PJJ66848.1 outer membrane lipoprotein-sorting protein [Chryseobacterium geocarposphaerae]PZU14665.1 MAG: outer membrane lipoprotein carrier protein LolA [Chryseobacterium sp.]UMQ42599.1 outer membrane lipoprotein carrier protein LolA [Chryseobacterium sp. Y16C]
MKNIISKIILSGLVVGTVGLASAQKIDAKAKKILDDVTANYNSKKNSYFKFSFGSGVNGQISKTEPGIYYVAGDKYKLKIMETEQIFDGNKIYNINTEDMEVTIAKPNGSSAMFSPINYLTTYRKDYNVTYNGKKTVDGVSADFIKLTPVKNNGLEAVYIFVNSAKKQMLKLEQHGNNKDIAIISIKEYKENQTLDPNMFVFDKNKFKNYIITEL